MYSGEIVVPDELTIIVNTGDDCVVGLNVSPILIQSLTCGG